MITNMKKYIFSAICAILMALPFELSAQNAVKGRILDESGQPVIGAMVHNKDNGKWATTDLDGNYILDSAVKGNTIEITCLGYTAQSVTFNGAAVQNFTLETEVTELDEAVAIGYGSVKKKDLTGAVGMVRNDVIEQQSATQVSQRLQGTVPGLTVTRTSGMPGASATIQIRGVTTMSDNDPLILVDGMAVSSIDNVNPNDIDQITVLKDAASASIYGARAAAGVILITTKQAHEGEVNINYNGEVSVIGATQWSDYMTDPVTYMTMFNEYKWNDAGCPVGGDYQTYPKEYIESYMANNAMDPIEYPNFDWFGNIVKKSAMRHKHDLSMTYGGKVVQTRVSASYEKADALYHGSDYERINARTRNTIKISKHLSGEFDLSFKHSTKHDPLTTPLQAANMYPSVYLGLYPDGRVAPGKSGSNTLGTILEGGNKTNRTDYLSGKVALSWKPFEGFDLTGAFTPNFAWTKTKTMSRAVPYYDAYDTNLILGYTSGHATNDLTEVRNDSNSFETQAIATYEHSFAGKHNLNIMAGYENYKYFHEALDVSTQEMVLADFPYMDLASDKIATTGSAYENAYHSFFGRIMYNYASKYYIQLNARGDGSSRFAPGYRWGFFPSVSLGWVLSEENWLKNVNAVNYLKLRGSIGTLGNERIGNYAYQANIDFNKAIMLDSSGNITSQLSGAQTNYVIRDITWETTWTYDVGVDASFFNSRLGLTADYYYKETKGMLLDVKIPSFTGFGDPSQNAGTMHTNGWEVKIDWKDHVGDFNYGLGFNLSDYKSVMGNMNGTFKISDGKIITEGEEYNAWYGYKSSGLFRNVEEIAAAPTQLIATLAPGDLGYRDIGGTPTDEELAKGITVGAPDGKIDATYDRAVLGSSLPHFIYGGYINLGWKGLNLNILFNGVGKRLAQVTENMVRPFASQWLAAPSVIKDNYFSEYNTEEQNAKVFYPRLSYTSAEKNNYMVSDYWLFNGAYFRVKNINLSYTIPSKCLDKARIKGLKLYFNVDDPLCFSNFLKGWDPEQGTNTYIARTFTLGLDIKF